MITDYVQYFDPNQTQLMFDASGLAALNGTPIDGYVSCICEVSGLDLVIELLIVIVILLMFILYYIMRASRRWK